VQLKLPSAASEESISFVTCPFTDAKLGRWRNIYGSTSSITYSIVSQFELCRIPLLGISVFFPFQYYDTVVIDCLGVSGTVMHMFTILYFLVKNVPIFFTEERLGSLVRDVIRLSFCYWIMRKRLIAWLSSQYVASFGSITTIMIILL
jgi:hypothetical protein